jgi:TetR/AcrR family transcriptional regulator, regulator of biofilm formation and stress response
MEQAYQTRGGRGGRDSHATGRRIQGRSTTSPRGAARRDAILRAAIDLIGERGPDALTHRAVAERAVVPLSATTYYFTSKEDLFEEAVALAANEEVERLERLVLELAPRQLAPADWARELSAFLCADLAAQPARSVAFYEFVLEAARRPPLRAEVARWESAHLRLAEVGLRAAGSNDPQKDALVVVAAITGLMLAHLTTPDTRFERDVLRPALERLFVLLTSEPASAEPARRSGRPRPAQRGSAE